PIASLPRRSRVANSPERRGLAERSACAEDARATNLVLTELGAETHRLSRDLYASAVRELVLDGLQTLPGDGVAHLAELAYAVLTTLDPRGDHSGSVPEQSCAADPADTETCAADPENPEECAADPVEVHAHSGA